jgi:hypothetical protein
MKTAKGKFLKFLFPGYKPWEGEPKSEDKGGKKDGLSSEEVAALTELLTKEGATPTEEQVQKLSRHIDRSLLKETMDRKAKLRKLESDKTAADEAKLRENGEFQKLLANAEPKVKRLEALEPVLDELYTLEIADIPEDKRKLIPDFPTVEQKIKWVKEAKAAKLFGEPATAPPAKKPPVGSDPKKPNADGTTPEFCSWAPNDKRLEGLSLDEYKVWKAHNRAPSTGIAGWGGK